MKKKFLNQITFCTYDNDKFELNKFVFFVLKINGVHNRCYNEYIAILFINLSKFRSDLYTQYKL